MSLDLCEIYSGNDKIINYNKGSDVTATTTADGVYSVSDFVYDNDVLDVNIEGIFAERVRHYEKVFQRFDIMMDRSDRHAYALRDQIDQHVFGNHTNAGLSIDDGDFATATNGGAGNSVILSSSNIDELFDIAYQQLAEANANLDDLFCVMNPKTFTFLNQYGRSNGFVVSDDSIRNGYRGQFNTFRVYISNNLDSTTDAGTTHLLMGSRRSIFLAIPAKGTDFNVKEVPLFSGKELVSTQIFNSTIWSKVASQVIDVNVVS